MSASMVNVTQEPYFKPCPLNDSCLMYAEFFKEIDSIALKNNSIWGESIIGPILLVDPKSRIFYSNTDPDKQHFTNSDTCYTGVLPPDIHIWNTTLNWKGKKWAMVMLPLSNIPKHAISVNLHELTHVFLSKKGFPNHYVDVSHLTEKEGRILISIELRLMKKYLSTNFDTDYLREALAIRSLRYNKYIDGRVNENLLELNEGLAEYSGTLMSGLDKDEIAAFYSMLIDNYLNRDDYDRVFAYITTPIYGYAVKEIKESWCRGLSPDTDLTSLFIKEIGIVEGSDVYNEIVSKYGFQDLILHEEDVEKQKIQITDSIRAKFISKPHFEIDFERMSITSLSPNTLTLRDLGIFYDKARVTDDWGEITIESGFLLSSNFKKGYLTFPSFVSRDSIVGDGYRLYLKSNYYPTLLSDSVYHLARGN